MCEYFSEEKGSSSTCWIVSTGSMFVSPPKVSLSSNDAQTMLSNIWSNECFPFKNIYIFIDSVRTHDSIPFPFCPIYTGCFDAREFFTDRQKRKDLNMLCT